MSQTDQDQLDLFAAEGADRRLPPAANLVLDRDARDGECTALRDAVAVAQGLSDPDEVRRLEASIRWLQDESVNRRLPRAPTLPPVAGLAPPVAELRPDAGTRREVERQRDVQLRAQEGLNPGSGAGPGSSFGADPGDGRALDPDRLLPPRSMRHRGLVKLLIASVVAAPPAYFIAHAHSLGGGADFTVTLPGAATLGAIETRIAALLPAPRPRRGEPARVRERIAAAADVGPPAPPAMSGPQDEVAPAPEAVPERVARVAAVPDDALRESPPPQDALQENVPEENARSADTVASRPEPALSGPDRALLVERGRAFFDAGDVAAARLMFRRAAGAGDAAAALAMGATYDPAVLANHFVRGMGADLVQARSWYEKARELGSPEGPRRLEMLAHR